MQSDSLITVKSYRDLEVWQRAIELTLRIYRMSQSFPLSETYGLTSQLRRAGVSVAGNIAEGHGRITSGEFRHFLGLSRGSLCELQTQLLIARALGYSSANDIDECESLANEFGKMLNAILASIEARHRQGNVTKGN